MLQIQDPWAALVMIHSKDIKTVYLGTVFYCANKYLVKQFQPAVLFLKNGNS